jgi:acyl-CoA synthetase (AMP-forming)/AMP-acid ligase II
LTQPLLAPTPLPRLAAQLSTLGKVLNPNGIGRRVMFLHSTHSIASTHTPAIIWGTHWAGGIISPTDPDYTSDELAFQLKEAGAKALATQKPS